MFRGIPGECVAFREGSPGVSRPVPGARNPRSTVPSKYGRTMKLLEVAKLLSLLDESIDIHGLAKLHKGNQEFEQAVKEYRSTLQGRKKELLKPFGLDDLDKFKKNPEGFVKMVGYAVDSFAEKKEQKALYKKLYEDDRCLVTVPKGPKGAAAAGSFCKVDGEPVCPWCVCIKYPDNEKWWKQYGAATLVFVYSKEDGAVSDACCILLSHRDALSILGGTLAYSQVEGLENRGLGRLPVEQRKVLERLYGKSGLTDARLVEILTPTLKPKEGEFKTVVLSQDILAAAESGESGRVQECLKGGADVNVKDNEGCTPLHWAAKSGDSESCRLLIDAGADVNDPDKSGLTPLHVAGVNRRHEICKLLIDAGADVNTTDNFGLTPLHVAAKNKHYETCKVLIDAGADVNAISKSGRSPLDNAVRRGHLETCKVLIDAGADVNASPLLYQAAQWGFLEICELFINSGADVNSRVNDFTPLSIARLNGHPEVEELLLKAGARE